MFPILLSNTLIYPPSPNASFQPTHATPGVDHDWLHSHKTTVSSSQKTSIIHSKSANPVLLIQTHSLIGLTLIRSTASNHGLLVSHSPLCLSIHMQLIRVSELCLSALCYISIILFDFSHYIFPFVLSAAAFRKHSLSIPHSLLFSWSTISVNTFIYFYTCQSFHLSLVQTAFLFFLFKPIIPHIPMSFIHKHHSLHSLELLERRTL
ncbi:hypothetical protein BJ165DRAFT_713088 [Panaeolus papilionaceus]|nr:hypothetical protein BJ165DRAFT_713088 [Panaeolus papilionaceus]